MTITGNNFNTNPLQNIVYFGGVKTAVLSATSTSLTVTAPTGTSYLPISVTANNLTAYSSKPFVVTFGSGSVPFDANSFDPKVDHPLTSSLTDGAAGDFDGDGKLDLAVVDNFVNSLSILRNTGTGNAVSFVGPTIFDGTANAYSVETLIRHRHMRNTIIV